MAGEPVPADPGQRFALITDNNHSGYLWIASILCLIYSSLVLITRLHIKWNLYGADDVLAGVATLMQLGQVIPLFLALNHGLGQASFLLSAFQIASAGRSTFAAQIFLILALATAKASVAALMLRLFTRDMEFTRKTWVLCILTLSLTLIWGIGSITAISISCNPTSFLSNTSNSCASQDTRWRIIVALDIFIELLLILLPCVFVYPIQMKPYIKLQVILAFSFRLPTIGFAATHLHYITSTSSANPRADISQEMIPILVYQQFELFWSLLAATIPTLKAFMRSFNSGFGMEIDLDGYGYGSAVYGSGQGYNNHGAGSYPLESLQSGSHTGVSIVHKQPEMRPRTHPTVTPISSDLPNTTTASSSAPTRTPRYHTSPITMKSRNRTPTRHVHTKSTHNSNNNTLKDTGHMDGYVDRPSLASDDGSQELIIQREVRWSVYYSDRDSSGTPVPGGI